MRRLIFILLAMIGVSQAQTIQYIGAPTTTVISRGNFRTDSIFYLPKRSKAPTDTAAFRYQISDSSLYVWTGSQWIKAGGIDTTTISTRAWRQKGDDSLGAIIATKGSGTVTSVATGYGLSGGTITTTGTLLVDTLNIATRAWRQKGLDSLAALEVSGSGTTNYIPKFTAGSTIGNSSIVDNGTGVGVGISPTANTKLYIRTNTATDAAIYSDNGTNTGFIVKYGSEPITNIGNDFNRPLGFLTNNTERLRITSGGNVGIGISTPANNGTGETGVEIRGANYPMFTISTPTISQFSGVGLTSGYIGTSTNHPFTILSNSAERLRIFANGRVGINTTTDAGYQLDVNGTGYFASTLTLGGGSRLSAVSGNALNFNTNGTDRVTISSGGNVGIGTASPLQLFTVKVNSSETVAIQDQAGFGGLVFKHITTSAFRDGTIDAANLYLQSQSGGEVRINTTSDAGDYKLQVNGNIYNTGSAVLSATSGEAYIGTTSDAGNYKLQVSGQAFIRNTATSGALYLDSTSLSIYEVKNRHAILISGHSLTGAEIQGPIYVGTNWNTSSDVSAIEVALSNTASGANSNLMKLSDGTNTFRVTKDAGIFTAAPSGGTARKWKLGSVVSTSVILDTANYVEVEINGVAYKLALATPN